MRRIVEIRLADLDCYWDWINNLDKIVECHYKKATHILDEKGDLVKIEIGFHKCGGMPYVMVGEHVKNYSVCDFPGD